MHHKDDQEDDDQSFPHSATAKPKQRFTHTWVCPQKPNRKDRLTCRSNKDNRSSQTKQFNQLLIIVFFCIQNPI